MVLENWYWFIAMYGTWELVLVHSNVWFLRTGTGRIVHHLHWLRFWRERWISFHSTSDWNSLLKIRQKTKLWKKTNNNKCSFIGKIRTKSHNSRLCFLVICQKWSVQLELTKVWTDQGMNKSRYELTKGWTNQVMNWPRHELTKVWTDQGMN